MKKIEHKIIDGVKCKRCSKCKTWKPLSCFNKNKSMCDGLQSECKSCLKQYYVDNGEQKKQYSKQYYVDNAKQKKQYNKQYHIDNAEKAKQYNKQYYIANAEKAKQNNKQYYKQPALYKVYADQLCWCEEVRQNCKFLEVKCAYCGRWFSPTNRQVQSRISAVNGKIPGEHRIYCSENCKQACPTYNQNKYPKGFKQATSREVVPLLRQLVLKRDNYTCQKCGATTETAQLHVHHIIPYAQNKMQANDPDSCITLCKKCHQWIHSQEDCRYVDLRCTKS